jgi:diguanylate cyclase (GGDEF)-like protein/putative nucleotidyltransferase with HDIG domain
MAQALQPKAVPMPGYAVERESSPGSAAARLRAAVAQVCASPHLLTFYVTSVIASALIVVVWRLPQARMDEPLLFVALLLASAAISASKVHLPLVSGSATLSMSYFTDFMSLVLLGPDLAMVVAGIGGGTQCLLATRHKVPVRQIAFSVAALILSVQASGLAASWLGGFHRQQDLLAVSKPAVFAAAAFFLSNSWLVATAVALSRRESVLSLWQQNFMWTAPACFIGGGVAVLAIRVVMTMQIWVVLLAAAPLYLTYRSYRIYLGRVEDHHRHLKQVSDLHLASVEALARAIDARDQTFDRTTGPNDNHIRRVQAAAAQLARVAGMSADEVEGVKVAALLHDIGKLAVPEHILTKPGRLTPDEFERVRIHPQIGADIIRAVPFPYPVAPFIESHHERWDGSGYPQGLAGEAIPLGARVLAVVDYYDALINDRPYHRAMDGESAIDVLRSERRKALDPRLVELFIELLPSISMHDPAERQDAETRERAQVPVSGPANGFSSESVQTPPVSTVYQNISRATQEMHALYDIAQTLGTRLSVEDTMGLLTSKLTRLVPVSCWALYLYDESSQTLQCRFASGLEADHLDGMTIPIGEGASGWAARHRTPAVNARADADLEAGGRMQDATPLRSALVYPLVDGNDLVGTLTVYHADESPFRDDHRRLLDRVCHQVASVIRNSLLFEQMHQVSLTDSLTEMPNSRALFTHLSSQFGAVSTGASGSALLMFDLNGFKAINDKYGHQVGDLALREVSAAIRQNVRQGDFCARYAGDEFVVVLSECGRVEAERRAINIQRAVAALHVKVTPSISVGLSISVGVAVSPEDGTEYDDLLAAADRRMYQNKASNRTSNWQVGTSLPIAG